MVRNRWGQIQSSSMFHDLVTAEQPRTVSGHRQSTPWYCLSTFSEVFLWLIVDWVEYSEEISRLIRNQKWFNKDATYVHQHNNSYTEWNRIILYTKNVHVLNRKTKSSRASTSSSSSRIFSEQFITNPLLGVPAEEFLKSVNIFLSCDKNSVFFCRTLNVHCRWRFTAIHTVQLLSDCN